MIHLTLKHCIDRSHFLGFELAAYFELCEFVYDPYLYSVGALDSVIP